MSANPIDAYWLPFTANRDFKARPRVISGAAGHYYIREDGTRMYLSLIHISEPTRLQ